MNSSAYIVGLKSFYTVMQDMYIHLTSVRLMVVMCSLVLVGEAKMKDSLVLSILILISLVFPFKIFSQGANFADVIQMTDIFEGSIIRSARRLDEFLNQVNKCPPRNYLLNI